VGLSGGLAPATPASPEIPRLLAAEQQRTHELTQEGFVQELLLRADGTGGYMTMTADSAESARDRLATLPFIENELMHIELVPLTG
jgi:muconolactone delta-isomerase